MTKEVQNSNFILRMLVGFRVISDEQRILFTEVLSDGSNVILLSLIFLVTPGFVTQVGCLLVGSGYPIYATVASVTNKIPRAQKWWLMYWIVFVCFSLFHDFISVGFNWLPLWYHLRLITIVWLQLPYFRGAEWIFMSFLNKWKNINSEVQRDQQQQNGSGGGTLLVGTPPVGTDGINIGRSSGSSSSRNSIVDPGTPSVPPLPSEGGEEDEVRGGARRSQRLKGKRNGGGGSGGLRRRAAGNLKAKRNLINETNVNCDNNNTTKVE